MRLAILALATLTFVGCSADNVQRSPIASSPTTVTTIPSAPTTPIVRLASLWTMVIDANEGGVCLVGATVEVIEGKDAGQRLTQNTPCDVWGADGGFFLEGLTPGAKMTLRFSAQGYAPKNLTVLPGNGGQVQVVTLSKL